MRPRRDDFSIPAGTRYLNCAYMSPLPRAVEEAGIEGVRGKRDPSRIEAHHFFDLSNRARALFAGLIGADAAGVAIVPGVSYAMEVVARNLDAARPGRTYVVLGDQFPANVYPWVALAERAGGEVRTVDRPPGGEDWTGRVLDAIDAATALVALPQAHWTDGTLIDLAAVGARARDVGAAFVIDGTQSIGAMPFDATAIGADAVACAGYKWLLGPYSLGFVWLGARFRGGTPLEQTWIGRAGSEDFRALVDYTGELRDDASRFDVAERSNFTLMPMAVAALEYLEALGVNAVKGHCAELTARLAAGSAALGAAPPAGPHADHIVGLRLPGAADGAAVFDHLRDAGIHVSRRGAALRVSPHVYNGHEDVDAFLAELAEALP